MEPIVLLSIILFAMKIMANIAIISTNNIAWLVNSHKVASLRMV
jgi:hypothetical protein